VVQAVAAPVVCRHHQVSADVRLLFLTLSLIAPALLAQDAALPVDGGLDRQAAEQSARQNPNARELTVLSPTLAPEELDRAVLNRLLQDITHSPERVMAELSVSETQLEDISISLANAAGFINNNEMASIRAMCRNWHESGLEGEARIEAALEAYRTRRQFTRDFIAMYYRVVVMEIESFLDQPTRHRFNRYMDDRRRRMANAGNVVPGSVVENVSSGAESVNFHCRR
jgi:hypothetical protein